MYYMPSTVLNTLCNLSDLILEGCAPTQLMTSRHHLRLKSGPSASALKSQPLRPLIHQPAKHSLASYQAVSNQEHHLKLTALDYSTYQCNANTGTKWKQCHTHWLVSSFSNAFWKFLPYYLMPTLTILPQKCDQGQDNSTIFLLFFSFPQSLRQEGADLSFHLLGWNSFSLRQ